MVISGILLLYGVVIIVIDYLLYGSCGFDFNMDGIDDINVSIVLFMYYMNLVLLLMVCDNLC